MKKQSFKFKGWYIVVLALIFLGVTGNLLKSSEKSGSSESKPMVKALMDSSQIKAESKRVLKERLEGYVNAYGKKPDYSQLNSVEEFTITAAVFNGVNNAITEGQRSDDPELNKLAEKVKSLAKTYHKTNLPKLRMAYGDYARKVLWEEDCDVTISGKDKSTITFTAALFAANKNIKKTHQDFLPMLNELRFKRANYKWMKYEEEYTYFNIESIPDDFIVK